MNTARVLDLAVAAVILSHAMFILSTLSLAYAIRQVPSQLRHRYRRQMVSLGLWAFAEVAATDEIVMLAYQRRARIALFCFCCGVLVAFAWIAAFFLAKQE